MKNTNLINHLIVALLFTIISGCNDVGTAKFGNVQVSNGQSPVISYAGSSGTTGTFGTSMFVGPNIFVNEGATMSSCVSSPSLPAGLSLNPLTCVISGVPSAMTSGPTLFVITATNTAGSSTANVTLTINPNTPTLSYASSAGKTIFADENLNVSPSVFSTRGASLTNCSVSPALPSWASINNSTCAISGTPTGTLAATTYTITATNSAGSTSATVQLQVMRLAPALSYLTSTGVNALMRVATTITPSTLNTNGAAITSCTISPALSSGLSINNTTCVISGTPTATSMATIYTVTATNLAGSTNAAVTITVDANSPDISYYGSTGTSGVVGLAMSVSPTGLDNNGAAITNCSTSPALPSGLSINSSTCVISGTPTSILSSTSYTVTATNSVGTGSASVNLSVVSAPSAPTISYAGASGTSGAYGVAMSVSPVSLVENGSSLTSCTISPALSAGLSFNTVTCVVSGTPSATLTSTPFTVTATNAIGSSTATVSLSISASVPTISYSGVAGSSGSYGSAMSVTPTTLSANGGALTNCSVSPALPVWASINTSTCEISGTPNATLSSTSYTVTATNSAGSSSASVSLSVAAVAPTISYAGATGISGSYGSAMSVTPTTLSTNGSALLNCSVSPALPAWASINTSTCVISGTPNATLSSTSYTITATNAVGSTSATVSLEVAAAAPTLSYLTSTGTSAQVRVSTSITPSTLSTNGASITNCTVSPALSAGLSLDASTCVISGTPTATSMATIYTVTATNSAGSANATVTITVEANTPVLSYSGATGTNGSVGSAMSISPTTLSNEGAAITNCTVSPALPSGLSLNATTCVISGTPTVTSANTSYSVTATNSVGTTSATVNLSVGASTPTLSYSGATGASGSYGSAMSVTPTTLDENGAAITNCTISPALSSGLSINSSTCIISGTPTALLTSTSYTVTVTNSVGSSTANVSLSVGASAPTISYSGATGTNGTYGSAMSVTPTTLSSNGSALTGCSISPALPAWASISASTCVISGTPNATLSSTSYTITATNSIGPSTATVSLSVAAAVPTISYSGVSGSANIGIATSLTPSTLNTNGAAVSSCSSSPSLPSWASLDPSTCVISGTPDATLSATAYAITATNSAGSSSATITLTVTALSPPVLSITSTNPSASGTPSFAITLTGNINYTNGDVITLYEGGDNTCSGVARGTSTITGSSTSSVSITSNTSTSTIGDVVYYAKLTSSLGSSVCSSSGVTYTHLPSAPTSLVRLIPTGTPGNNATPTITVSGGSVTNGAKVTLYSDSSCSSAVSLEKTSTGSSVDIMTDTLSEGAYTFYAKLTLNSLSSACSSIGNSANYVLDLTDPSVPAIAFNPPTASPGTSATPSFTISLLGGGSFDVADTITLYAQAACAGSSVGSASAVSSTDTNITASTQSNDTTVTYSVKVTDNAGNSTCSSSHTTPASRSLSYLYDASAPTWSNTLSNASASTSTTTTPSVSFTANASDGTGSGIAKYQYSIGTTSGGTQTVGWTDVGGGSSPSSPIQVTGLTLTGGTTYYFNMRAVDNVARTSTVYTSSWLVPIATELRFTTQPSSSTKANANMASSIVVKATNSSGTVDTSFNGYITIALASNPTSATISATSLSVQASSGVATFANVNVNKVGSYTVAATTTALTSATSNSFAITADRLTFVTQPTDTPSATTISTVTVKATDGFDNVDTSFASSITVAINNNPASGALSGTAAVTASAGSSSFSSLSINNAGTGYTLKATATGLTQGNSNSFNITTCSLSVTSGTTTLTDGSSYTTVCVTGTGSLVIPSGITTTINNLFIASSSATVTLNQNMTFQNVTVTSGLLTSAGFDNLYSGSSWTNTPGAGNGKLIFTVTGTLSVGASGRISMDVKGYAGGISAKTQGGSYTGPGGNTCASNGGGACSAWYAASGSYGTRGSEGSRGISYAPPSSTYGESDFVTALYLGSGGGYSVNNGGAGGGAIKITAGAITLASGAQITAKGGNGVWNNPQISGSGSGGTIVLDTSSFTNSGGLVSVAGGSGSGLVGGYGRMYIPLNSLISSNNMDLTGLQGLAVNLRATDAINTMTLGANSEILFTADSGATVDTLTINSSTAQFILNQNFTFGTVNLTSGTITSIGFDNIYSGTAWTNSPAPGNGQLIFGVTNTLTVGATGIIHMDYKGYGGGNSTKSQGGSPSGAGSSSTSNNGGGGGGPTASPWYGGAGSYGTAGSIGNAASVGSTYGASDFTTQLYLGSGGAASYYGGGAGGGAIKITAGSMSLASGAQINARGLAGTWNNPQASGSGSGGTIVLNTPNFSNSGATISAAGGTYNFSTGGYGRVSLPSQATLNLATLSGVLNVTGSSAISTLTVGASSNVYLTLDAGITVDTLTINGASAMLSLNQSFTFNTVNVTNGTLTSNGFDNLYSGSSWTNTPSAGNGKLIFTVTGTLSVGATGVISMDGKGYAGGTSTKTQGGSYAGPGSSGTSSNGGGGGSNGAGAGSYGASGSYGTLATVGGTVASMRGSTYGASDFTTQLYLGSGGGYGNNTIGSAGGGAISITAATVSLASGAQINSKGTAGGYAGAGSGGTIVISTSSFTNSGGVISVAGGTNVVGGPGGYGRMFITPSALKDASNNMNLTGLQGFGLNLGATDAINTMTLGASSIIYFTADSGASVNTLTINGSGAQFFCNQAFTFNNVNVTSGLLTANGYDNIYSGSSWTNTPGAGNGKLIFTVTGTLTVGASGQIAMDAKGYAGGIASKTQGGSYNGPGSSGTSPNGGGGGSNGAGAGVFGISGSYGTLAPATGTYVTKSMVGSTYGASDFTTELYLGSGGGYGNSTEGAYGGGAISITASAVSLASGGQITAKGGTGGYAGAGSGGTIVISTSTFTNSGGTISVNGGTNPTGGAGGYGRISVSNSALKDSSNNMNLTGFQGFALNLSATDAVNTMTIGANTVVFFTATSGASVDTLTINGSGAQFFCNQAFTFNTVNVTSGLLTANGFDSLVTGSNWTNSPGAGNGKLIFTVTGTLTVGASGQIVMDSKGYSGGFTNSTQGGSPTGPGTSASTANGGGGGGTSAQGSFAGAGSYGFLGTQVGTPGIRGSTYGLSDFTTQLYLGSGGGYSSGGIGGYGGGAISITAGTINVASGALITSKGGSGSYNGGGSGGTILLSMTTFTNSGATISVAGGTNSTGSVGGNGRLAITYTSCTGSYCPHNGGALGSQYVPKITYYSAQCVLASGIYTCIGDTDTPYPPTSVTLQNPASTPGSLRTPTIRVGGGYSWYQGRVIKLYSNSSCTSVLASGNISTGSTLDITIPSLSSDNSYLFYATIVNEYGNESSCSSVAAAYVLNTTPANVPVIANNTSTPNTISQPVFDITVSGGGNFEVDDVVTLQEGADCNGSAVSAALVPGAVLTATRTRSNGMSEGTTTFRIKLTNSAGNSTCSNGVSYNYDNTAPTWTSGPIIAATDNPYNSTTASPGISWTNDASDSNSGVSSYEYALGTGTSGASASDLKAWTTVASSPFTVTGLSLSNGQRYYVNMRSVDNVGLKSSIVSDYWVVDTNGTTSITLAEAYPTNGAKWNDYVKNDGADTISGTDTACVGTETNITDCMHAGEIRKATIAAESSCTGLIARDNLGAFNWSCKVVGGQAVIYSTGLKSTKSVRDLIDFAGSDWKVNYLIVTGGAANTTYQSASAKWWSNAFAALPDNSANGGTSQSLSGASGTIYLLSSSRATSGGYTFGADKLAIVGDAGVTLTWNTNSATTTTSCGSRSIICAYNRKFVWVDIATSGGTGTNVGQYGYFISGTSHSRFGNLSVSGTLTNGVYVTGSTKCVFGNITASNSAGGNGVYLTLSTKNLFGNITANSNYSNGLVLYNTVTDNTFGNVTANSNLNTADVNTGAGVLLSLSNSRNTFTSITATGNKYYNFLMYSSASNNITITGALTASSSVSSTGASLNGSGHSVGSIVANSNGGGHGIYLASVSNSTFGTVTANNNYSSGLYLYNTSIDNTFGTVTANSNLNTGDINGGGVVLSLANHRNTFSSITASGNKYSNFNIYSSASNNITITGALNVSNSVSSTGAKFSGTGHSIGSITANNNGGGHGVYLSSTTSSTFGTVTANSNYGSGLYLYNNSNDNTFGAVTANSNLSTSDVNGGGVVLSLANHRNTFNSITATNNTYRGMNTVSSASNNITVTNTTNISNSGTYGLVLSGTGHRFGSVYANNNGNNGVYIAGCTDCRFTRVVANGNRGTTEGGVLISATSTDLRFTSVTAVNNTFVGFYITGGTISGLLIRDYMILANNAYGFANNVTLNTSIINNATVTNNTNYGINVGTGSTNIFHNILTANNGTYGFGLGSGTNNTIVNLISTNNGTFGISHATQTTAAYLGVLMVGNNTSGNCTVSGGTTPGLVNTTCSSAGTDGSNTYGTGAFSTAALRISKTLASSFAGFVGSPGDTINSSDGSAGIGAGVALWDSSLDMLNFDNIFRAYSNPGSAISGLSSSQYGPGVYGSNLKIWDWSLAAADTTILNKSGNGSNINNGITLTSNGTISPAGTNSFVAGSSCPLQTLGDQYTESRPYTYDITNNPVGVGGFQSAGSGTACASGNTTCVRRFLSSATEIIGDGIGNDDGLCESNESCVYTPNFGAYQGHFDTNEAYPAINDSTHECTWTSNSGLITNVRMYGYSKNGR